MLLPPAHMAGVSASGLKFAAAVGKDLGKCFPRATPSRQLAFADFRAAVLSQGARIGVSGRDLAAVFSEIDVGSSGFITLLELEAFVDHAVGDSSRLSSTSGARKRGGRGPGQLKRHVERKVVHSAPPRPAGPSIEDSVPPSGGRALRGGCCAGRPRSAGRPSAGRPCATTTPVPAVAVEESTAVAQPEANSGGIISAGEDAASSIFLLPEGWETAVSRSSGETYYHNTKTGESTFERPIACVLPAGSPPVAAGPPLPPASEDESPAHRHATAGTLIRSVCI